MIVGFIVHDKTANVVTLRIGASVGFCNAKGTNCMQSIPFGGQSYFHLTILLAFASIHFFIAPHLQALQLFAGSRVALL